MNKSKNGHVKRELPIRQRRKKQKALREKTKESPNYLKVLRFYMRDLSQGELSRRSGIDQGHISRVLAENTVPTLDTMMQLLTALKVPAKIKSNVTDELLGDRMAGKELSAAVSSLKWAQEIKADDEAKILLEKIEYQNGIMAKVGRATHGKSEIFFHSSLLPDGNIHQGFYKASRTLINLFKMKEVYVASGQHRQALQKHDLPLKDDTVKQLKDKIYGAFIFGDRLFVTNNPIAPQKENPFQGMTWVGQKPDTSLGTGFMSSAIFPSPRLDYESMPASNGGMPRTLYCSGSMTEANYRDTEAGIRGRYRHKIGALVVVTDKDIEKPLVMNIEASEDGSFHFRGWKFLPNGKFYKEGPSACYFSDVHAGLGDSLDRVLFFAEDAERVGAKEVVAGDLHDNSFNSHHQKDDIFAQVNRPMEVNTLFREICAVIRSVRVMHRASKGTPITILGSNHHDHLKKYLKDAPRWTSDVVNVQMAAKLFSACITYGVSNPLQYAAEMILSAFDEDEINKIVEAPWRLSEAEVLAAIRRSIDPKEFCEKRPNRLNVTWINHSRNDDHFAAGSRYQTGMHGDVGPNGAKGSVNNIGRIFPWVVIGHGHTPKRKHDVSQVGVMNSWLDYALGPSGWEADVVYIYPDNTVQRLALCDPKMLKRIEITKERVKNLKSITSGNLKAKKSPQKIGRKNHE